MLHLSSHHHFVFITFSQFTANLAHPPFLLSSKAQNSSKCRAVSILFICLSKAHLHPQNQLSRVHASPYDFATTKSPKLQCSSNYIFSPAGRFRRLFSIACPSCVGPVHTTRRCPDKAITICFAHFANLLCLAVRFLDLVKPFLPLLPEVSSPETRVPFQQKLMWTGVSKLPAFPTRESKKC